MNQATRSAIIIRVISTMSLILAIACGCLGEAAYWAFPEQQGLRTILKAITAFSIILFAACRQMRKEKKQYLLLAAIVSACLADVVIVPLFPAGVALFAIAHICLIIVFCRKEPLHKTDWIIWIAISIAVVTMILILGSGMGIYAYGAAVYAPVLLLMAVSAVRQKGRIRMAGILFFSSDLLLAIYQWKHIHPVIHILYMGLFYAALILLPG